MNDYPFGVTFYPDQWPQDSWEENFSRIKQSGFNKIRFGEMSWSWFEPSDNHFSFDEADKAMDLASKHGIGILLGIPTSTAPLWLIKKHHDLRPVSHEGTLYPEYGPRPNICRDNPVLKEYAGRLTREIVNRYKDHPALWMWQIDNEPVFAPLDETGTKDYCHCNYSQKAFQEWTLKKYGSLESINKNWGTRFWTNEFSTLEEITPPRAGMWDAVNPHIFLDWFRFKTQSLRDWLIWLKLLVSDIDKNHKIGTNGFLGIAARTPEHEKLAKEMDWYGWDVYPRGNKWRYQDVAYGADLWRSFIPQEKEFHVTELQGGQNVRWGYQGQVFGREIRIRTHQCLAHGAKAILYHQWRTGHFGAETCGFSILSPYGKDSERLKEIENAGREIKKISEILNGHKIIPDAALYYSRTSDVETYQEQGPPRVLAGQWEPTKDNIGIGFANLSLKNAQKILYKRFNPIKILLEDELENNLLPYKVIILTNPYLMSEKQVANIFNFVSNGGTVISESRFAIKDKNGMLHKENLLKKYFDIEVNASEIIDEFVEIPDYYFEAYGFREWIESDGKIIAKFEDETPAIILKDINKGRFIYAAFSLFMSLQENRDDKLFYKIIDYLPSSEVSISKESNVELSLWKKDEERLLYLINTSGKSAKEKLRLDKKFSTAKIVYPEQKDLNIFNKTINLNFDPREVKIIILNS